MTPQAFRTLALSLPEAVEGAHQGHADFRVGGKIFATLGPEEDWAMVKLTTEAQASWVRAEPMVFQPFGGAWGRQGCTRIDLANARKASVRKALSAAWRNTAPNRLITRHDAEDG